MKFRYEACRSWSSMRSKLAKPINELSTTPQEKLALLNSRYTLLP